MVLQASLLVLLNIFNFFPSLAANDIPQPKNDMLPLLAEIKLPEPSPSPTPVPEKKVLDNEYQVVQTFNNCGPASLSLVLRYFNIDKSQEELGQQLRPYQNPEGDNDDKSVTLDELASKAEEFGLVSYHRPNGDISMLREFIAAGIPVITRTWMHADEDIGHYRVINGYDQEAKTMYLDDTFEGKALTFSYDEFNTVWSKFNYEYLVIVPKDKKALAETILGKNLDETYSWEQARDTSLHELKNDPENAYSRFNLSVAYYHLGDYKKSVVEYEKAAPGLPFRTLWYQIEPVDAYFKLGDYDRVFEISDSILNNQNRAYSELYLLRGQIYEKQGNKEAARTEYENAVFYNSTLKPAQDALKTLSLASLQ